MEKKTRILLIAIVLLAALLRFFKLGDIPSELTWDEVSWGYNAYSLGIDGKDEFGRFLPVDYLESFGDFKPPLYAYLSILPIKLFGMSAFAVRFTSALFGTLTVGITYFLVLELFKSKQAKLLGLISALILALSPWHINLSRAAFEANVASLFIILGILLFLYAVRKNMWLLTFSASSFVLSVYTFNTARIVAPILVIVLAISWYKKLIVYKKQVAIAVVIGLILSIPFLRFAATPQAKLRYREVNIFSDLSIIERTNKAMEYDRIVSGSDKTPVWSRILNNRRVAYGLSYVKHYLDHFNPDFLFIKGDGNPKFSTQDVGQMYLWDLPFFVVGLLFLIKRKEGLWWFLPLWILIGIAPAATARETPHALRIATTLPVWQIITAYGLVSLLMYVKNFPFNKLITAIVFVILFGNVVYYLHGYYIHYPIEYSGEWQYGYKEAIAFTESVKDDYDTIYFTNKLGRPYIYVLFYGRYDPYYFRTNADIERESYGFVHVYSIGKYYFTDMQNSREVSEENTVLYIGSKDQIPETAKVLKEFTLLNGKPSLSAYIL